MSTVRGLVAARVSLVAVSGGYSLGVASQLLFAAASPAEHTGSRLGRVQSGDTRTVFPWHVGSS